jgi:hypothetical protein
MLAGAAGHDARRNLSLKQRARSALSPDSIGRHDGRAGPELIVMGAVRVRSPAAHVALSVRAGLGGYPAQLARCQVNGALIVTEGRAGSPGTATTRDPLPRRRSGRRPPAAAGTCGSVLDVAVSDQLQEGRH